MRLRTCAAFLALLLLALPAAAQEQRGSIEGVVKDASGAILPGVTVTVTGSGVKLDTVSDSQGSIASPRCCPAIIQITASLQGFEPGKVRTSGRPRTDQEGRLRARARRRHRDGAGHGGIAAGRRQAERRARPTSAPSRSTCFRTAAISRRSSRRRPGANMEAKSGGIMIDGAARRREPLRRSTASRPPTSSGGLSGRTCSPISSRKSRSSRAATRPSTAVRPAA